MRVYLGADHQGFFLKNKVRDYLTKAGYQITDYSNEELDPDDDFPKYAKLAAKRVVDEKDDTDVAILVCGGGQGMCMAANRIKGVVVLPMITSASVSSTTPLPMKETHRTKSRMLVKRKNGLSGSFTLK